MDINELKGKAEELGGKAEELVGKAQEYLNNPEVREKVSQAKDKLEDFVEEKTDGKGIFGFGKKDD